MRSVFGSEPGSGRDFVGGLAPALGLASLALAVAAAIFSVLGPAVPSPVPAYALGWEALLHAERAVAAGVGFPLFALFVLRLLGGEPPRRISTQGLEWGIAEDVGHTSGDVGRAIKNLTRDVGTLEASLHASNALQLGYERELDALRERVEWLSARPGKPGQES